MPKSIVRTKRLSSVVSEQCEIFEKNDQQSMTKNIKNIFKTLISRAQTVKDRSTSTRNGFANSVSNYNKKEIPDKLLLERNALLEIDKNICFYCHQPSKTNDHLIPTVNQKKKIYGDNNLLNGFPCCKDCNSSKGPKIGKDRDNWLLLKQKWPQEKINRLNMWITENENYLYQTDENIKYIEKSFELINMSHSIWEDCAKTKLPLHKTTAFRISKELPNKDKEELIKFLKESMH